MEMVKVPLHKIFGRIICEFKALSMRTRINSDLNDAGLLFASDRNSTSTILGKKKNSLAEE